MTEYYVDPLAVGNDDGTTKTDAWTTIQRAIDGTGGTQPTAGDTVLLRAGAGDDETPGTLIDMDGNQGTVSALVRWIGVNSSWVNDASYYTIDAVSVASGLKYAALDYMWLENVEIKNASGAGLDTGTAGTDYHFFRNVWLHDNGGNGQYCNQNCRWSVWERCKIQDNAAIGIYRPGAGARFIFPVVSGNTGDGIASISGICCIHPIFYDNIGDGLSTFLSAELVFGGTFNANTEYGWTTSGANGTPAAYGCRFTNSPSGKYGMGYSSNRNIIENWNYFDNNLGGDRNNVDVGPDSLSDTPDTNQGYTSLTEGSEDFNLRSDATLRNTAIALDS